MFKKAANYLHNVRVEMGKVIWPPREQLIESTGVTLLLTVLMALFIFLADQVVSRIINVIL